MLIRPAREDDLEAMERLTALSFHLVDQRLMPRELPVPEQRTAAAGANWIRRTRHTLRTDPGGCWVAEVDSEVVGCAISRVRELMWILSSFAVSPELQGRGIGAQLLAASMQHGEHCLRGMLAASADPAAVRRYRLAGFTLHPQMQVRGTVERSVLPVVDRVREGSAGDVDLLDSLDRRTRGAAHLSDHELLLAQYRLLVADRPSGQGYAYVDATGAPVLLAATTRRTAVDLAWEALAASSPEVPLEIAHLTDVNAWALDVAVAARLSIHQGGYLCLRGMKPPAPYIHHGSLL
ncbi:GNAT family N-acetyltransferase [Nocardioides sp. AE5]|uniref:GNAT family N-acetyltransferase n=1 Tax=Nocardioides sp. AE5 TaxID=2962573 RepID=UPI0028816C0E|nr:GNAT family N-acetyltransferase [Nocardioides sp. AE5]MDT0201165.1 GNAT family N-acetyltransferase [Nocardioides sp. AE5]